MAAGLWAFGDRLANGMQVTNLTSAVPWGLWISFYILFIGLSAGSFILSTLVYVFGLDQYERIGRVAIFSAAVCLVMGMLFVLMDLGHMERFWHVFTRFSSRSVMWYEIMLYNVYVVILLAELWLLMRRDLVIGGKRETGFKGGLHRFLAFGSRETDAESVAHDLRVVRILGFIGLPTAISVHGGTGAIFAVIKAIPNWYTPLLPIVFIVSAAASGAALLLFFRAYFMRPAPGEETFLGSLAKMALGLLALDWLMVIFELLVGLYGGIPDHVIALSIMLFGPRWWIFWLLQVGVGLIIPVALILVSKNRKLLGAAGALIVMGIIGVRWNIVLPGQLVPKLEGLPQAVLSARLAPVYAPSMQEWLITIGLLALFMFLLSLGNKLLPLESTGGHSNLETR